MLGFFIIFLAVFVVRRLLGIERGRWFGTLLAVVLGEPAQEIDALIRKLLHGEMRTRVSLLLEPEDVRVARGC
ncbi:MAG: hypothetical protein M3P43_12155 [Actinomycetota bacterium]|nr:hypothetical protein [Actinomycetota bacterium]